MAREHPPFEKVNLDQFPKIPIYSNEGTEKPYIRSIPSLKPFFLRKMPVWKRFMDVVGSVIGLITLSPMIIIISLIIKIVSPGPVLFRQERIGYGGNAFLFLKFRTMKHNEVASAHQQYLAGLINGCKSDEASGSPMTKLDCINPNIFPFGRFLRNTCLDELPQLINVLRGEMSLVGPRPPISYEVEEYLRWHNSRFNTVPGMTGLWQVSGKNRLTFKEMIRLDIRYSQNISIWLDLKILLKTPLAIIQELIFYCKQAMYAREGVE
jgi:lipopolysaccharide/colanic/teichoic acid biosynthesis glycosyltransferase